MRKIIILLFTLLAINTYGYTSDSLKIVTLQREVGNLKSTISRLQQEDGRLRGLYQQQSNELDSLRANQQQQTENVKTLENKIGADISDANQKIDNNVSTLSESINSRTWLGALGILIAIGLLACAYYILRRKISSGTTTIDKIRSAQEGLETAQKAMQEESVKLDSKLVELLDKQINSSIKENKDQKVDHSFALKVGDEIAKIETNLSKMDPEVKGYRQLKQALKRIKDNFNAHGYEIVELLGLDYNDGMPFEAQFVPDETLPEGKRVISGITRLQINYNGEMIQSAKITVRQNI
jgi:predicted  nucleic acid-binding Zn-ribbon protein